MSRRDNRPPRPRRADATPIASARAFESLESRRLLSATGLIAHPNVTVAPSTAATPAAVGGLTPSQVRHAYQFDQVNFGASLAGDGSGQTIAIVDPFHDPNIAKDLRVFDKHFGLSDSPSFKVVDQSGGAALPAADANWAAEIALDVEWAHAVAPGASLLLVEANSADIGDLAQAVDTARQTPGVSVVSMSWGTSEFLGQAQFESIFATPAGHAGVTFVAASGDDGGRVGAEWPAVSANVLSVGGTTLTLSDAAGTYGGETAWRGSGGGVSRYVSQPRFQANVTVAATTPGNSFDPSRLGRARPFAVDALDPRAGCCDNLLDDTAAPPADAAPGFARPAFATRARSAAVGRSAPDVAYDADPATGFAVYDSYGSGGWAVVGGTSAGAPQWAALVAIANQGRALNALASLDGATDTLPMLYDAYAGGAGTTYDDTFHDVTTGSSAAAATRTGYDSATGLGSPHAPAVVAALGGAVASSPTAAVTSPSPAAPSLPTSQIDGLASDGPVTATPAPTATPPPTPVPPKKPRKPGHGHSGHHVDPQYQGNPPPTVHPAVTGAPAQGVAFVARTANPAAEAAAAAAVHDSRATAAAAAGPTRDLLPAAAAATAARSTPFVPADAPHADPVAAGMLATDAAFYGGDTGTPSPDDARDAAGPGGAWLASLGALRLPMAAEAASLLRSLGASAADAGAAVASGAPDLLYLPSGAVLLGLGSLPPDAERVLSERIWTITAGVSLLATAAGYVYCKLDNDRRRAAQAAGGHPMILADDGQWGG